MALIKCKECNKEVSDLAKKCPHCGISNPGITAGKMGKGCLVLIVIIAALSWYLGRDDNHSPIQSAQQPVEIKNGYAKNYEIIAVDDYNIATRSRNKIYVLAPDATTFEDRAATLQLAAKDYLHQQKIQEVTALLEVSKMMATHGVILAKVTYTPDGCNNDGIGCTGKIWGIESSSDNLTPQQIAISEAWFANRSKFLKKDGLLNETALKKFIAKKLKVQESDVTVPFISLKPIAIEK